MELFEKEYERADEWNSLRFCLDFNNEMLQSVFQWIDFFTDICVICAKFPAIINFHSFSRPFSIVCMIITHLLAVYISIQIQSYLNDNIVHILNVS